MPQAQRWELWIIDLGMVQKPRPCVILSIDFLNHERAVVTYVPRTTHLRQTRFEVPHPMRGLDFGVFDAQGIGSVPVAKLERRLGVVDPGVLQQVEQAVKSWLKLP